MAVGRSTCREPAHIMPNETAKKARPKPRRGIWVNVVMLRRPCAYRKRVPRIHIGDLLIYVNVSLRSGSHANVRRA
jgi:hypothetical protein